MKRNILKEIDAAIDEMDVGKIEAGLEKLPALSENGIVAEDPIAFASRVRKINKERTEMKKPFRFIPVAVAAVALMAGTAFAAGTFNGIIFPDDDKIITARSSEGVEVMDVDVSVFETEDAPPEQTPAAQADVTDFTFDSPEQAAEELDMVIPFPSALPEMEFQSGIGHTTVFSEDYQTNSLWLTYKDGGDRFMEIHARRHIVKPGTDTSSLSISDMDEGSYGTYTNKNGVEFSTFEESNDEGTLTVHIAATTVGTYDYSVNLMGFTEAERNEIIDSVDLSGLK